jgi:hypothetical protein
MARWRDRLAKAALGLGAAGLLMALAGFWVLPAAFGRTVTLVTTPNAPDIVDVNRAMWSKGEPVAPIYGTPVGEPMRILFPEKSRIIVPPEDPTLTLYTVDKSKGENPLQEQTARYVSTIMGAGSLVLLLAGVLHFVWKRVRPRSSEAVKL